MWKKPFFEHERKGLSELSTAKKFFVLQATKQPNSLNAQYISELVLSNVSMSEKMDRQPHRIVMMVNSKKKHGIVFLLKLTVNTNENIGHELSKES